MKYEELKELVKYHSDLYYKENKNEISDQEFDKLMRDLMIMEEEQGFSDEDSPTNKVGSDLKSSGLKHNNPMLSLMNTYNMNEVKDWYNKVYLEGAKEIVVEEKIDGISFAARYFNGELYWCATRGDGEIGEDIFKNASFIKDLKNIDKSFTGEVRGEIVFGLKNFEKLNTYQEFSNPRNAISGTMKLLDINKFKERAYAINTITYWLNNNDYSGKHSNDLKKLKDLGFKVPKYYICKNINDLNTAIENLHHTNSDYKCDGAVMKVNDKSLWKKIGSTAKAPKWAKAYKYEQESVKTKIIDIVNQVGRSGKVTPVAILEPVEIDGSIVSRVTLNNKNYIKEKDIRLNDYVDVIKSACIIPMIVKVYKNERSKDSKEYRFVEKCPCCGTELVKYNDSVDYFCPNENCQSRVVDKILNFTKCMEIDGFGEEITQKLYDVGLLKSIEDIYRLKDKKDQLVNLERMGDKSISNLLDNIEKSKSQPFEKLLSGIGIKNIGTKFAKNLINKFNDIDSLMNANSVLLEKTEGVGEITSNNIVEYFKDQKNIDMIKFLKEQGLNMTSTINKIDYSLINKSFCITGALSKPRKEIEEMIVSHGGKTVSSVSSKLSYLVTNNQEESSSKFKKAKELNIKIISEEELLKMIK